MDARALRLPDVDFATAPLPELHEVLAALRDREPVSAVRFAGKPTWLFNDHATVSDFIGSDHALSAPASCEPLFLTTVGRVLSTMSGQQHERNRADLVTHFTRIDTFDNIARILGLPRVARRAPAGPGRRADAQLRGRGRPGRGGAGDGGLPDAPDPRAAIDTRTGSLGSQLRHALQTGRWGARSPSIDRCVSGPSTSCSAGSRRW